MTASQSALIRAHLESGKPITPIEALDSYRCFRLAARINDLRRDGMQIDADTVTDATTGKRYAVYTLRKPAAPLNLFE